MHEPLYSYNIFYNKYQCIHQWCWLRKFSQILYIALTIHSYVYPKTSFHIKIALSLLLNIVSLYLFEFLKFFPHMDKYIILKWSLNLKISIRLFQLNPYLYHFTLVHFTSYCPLVIIISNDVTY